MTTGTLRYWKSITATGLAGLLAACGGGGGGGAAAPAAPAVIDIGNAAAITRNVIEAGLGAGAFGDVVGGGGILSADGGSNALAQGIARQRKSIQQVQPSVVIPAETFDCLVSGTLRLSGSLASVDTVTAGDRISVSFASCDDAEGAVYDGGLRLDITAFSGDIFSDQFLLGSRVTLTDLAVSEGGDTVTGNGVFDLDLDLTVPLVSDLAMSGTLLDVRSGSDAWVLRDFAITVVADGAGVDLLTNYSGTGTLEGADFDGAVDFVTVVPFVATGNDYPAVGEVLISGANGATIRATVLDAQSVQLAIDLDGDAVVDDTQQIAWSTVGPLGLTSPARTLASPVP